MGVDRRPPWLSDGNLSIWISAGSGDAVVVRLVGDVDAVTAERLALALDAVLSRGLRRVDVDTSGVRFLDSSGLRALLRATATAGDCTFCLSVLSPAVQRVLELAGLLDRFTGPGVLSG